MENSAQRDLSFYDINFARNNGAKQKALVTALVSDVSSESSSDGILVNHLDTEIKHTFRVKTEGPATFAVMIFLDGRVRTSVLDGEEALLTPGNTVLFHSARNTSGINHYEKSKKLQVLDIRYPIDILEKFGGASINSIAPLFAQNCSSQQAYFYINLTSIQIAEAARSIIDCPYDGMARKLFLSAKALEILAHLISSNSTKSSQGSPLNYPDKQKVKRAVQLLNEQYHLHWTIPKLALEVGVNERKLKAGFHQLVKSTIHQYLENARLNASVSLLKSGLSITETSLTIGYANPSHFAKRFKQNFGWTPSEFLRQKNRFMQNL